MDQPKTDPQYTALASNDCTRCRGRGLVEEQARSVHPDATMAYRPCECTGRPGGPVFFSHSIDRVPSTVTPLDEQHPPHGGDA